MPPMPTSRKYKVSWSKNGSISARQESEPMTKLSQARQVAAGKVLNNKSVTILKEDEYQINKGKFFLHLIVK